MECKPCPQKERKCEFWIFRSKAGVAWLIVWLDCELTPNINIFTTNRPRAARIVKWIILCENFLKSHERNSVTVCGFPATMLAY